MESHLLQMRGLKQTWSRTANLDAVASFTDAWIETPGGIAKKLLRSSHLLQMRGLKHLSSVSHWINKGSHLLQMRGLKPNNADKH